MLDFKCALCKDTGYVKVKKDFMDGMTIDVTDFCTCKIGVDIAEKEKAEKEKEQREKERLIAENKIILCEKYIKSGFGKIYVGASISDFNNNHSMKMLKSDIESDTWLYLYGDSRSGKTHLAAAIFKELGGSIIKSVSLDILISNYNNERRVSDIDSIASSKILFIDDIGVGKLTQERHSMYYYIIDYRISNNLKTIFTSNYKTVDLWRGSVDIDPLRIITRIQEASKGYEIKNREIV